MSMTLSTTSAIRPLETPSPGVGGTGGKSLEDCGSLAWKSGLAVIAVESCARTANRSLHRGQITRAPVAAFGDENWALQYGQWNDAAMMIRHRLGRGKDSSLHLNRRTILQ
jgi:hypothetical protein